MFAILGSAAFKYIAIPLLVVAFLGGAYAWVTTGAYNRGKAAALVEHQKVLDRLEAELARRLRDNEGLSDPDIDCKLKRLRNPGAACP